MTIKALILNYNGLEDTKRVLESLRKVSRINVLPYVLDNGSTNNEAPDLNDAFPEAEIVRSEKNLGFSRGVNELLIRSMPTESEYILLLNNDAYFDDDGSSILALYEALEEDPYVSAAGPIVRNLDNTIQSASYSHTMWFPYAFAKKSVPVQNKRINRGFLSGSCVMLRVSSFLEIHGLDPDFFLYGDDVDLAIRERRKGWKLVLVPKATVYHKRAAASKIYSHQYIYTALRGTLILINKQAQWYQKPTAFLTAAVISVALFFVSCARGRFGAAEPIVRAWRDYKRGYWSGLDGAPLTNVNRPTVRDAHVSEI